MILTLVVLCAVGMAAQETRTFYVVDAETGEALVAASVWGARGFTAVTNADGGFRVKDYEDGDELRVSFIGYKTFRCHFPYAGDIIRLQPATVSLDDVTVTSRGQALDRIVRLAVRQLRQRRSIASNYLYRQTTSVDGLATSVVEAFFEAHSAYTLRNLRLITGRYTENRLSKEEKQSHMSNLYPLSQVGLVGDAKMGGMEKMLIPLTPDYKLYYDIDCDVLDDGERQLYAIHFTLKEAQERLAFEGTLYVDTSTLLLQKVVGTIRNLQVVSNYGTRHEACLPVSEQFTVVYDCSKGFPQVQSVAVDAQYNDRFADYHFRSLCMNVGKRMSLTGNRPRPLADLRRQIDELPQAMDALLADQFVMRAHDEVLRTIAEDTEKSEDTINQAKLKRFVRNIENFNRHFPQEKVYLHTDNTGYYRGEKIWFKAYLIRDDLWSPLPHSSVLYVDLVSPSGEILQTRKLHVDSLGQADGNIQLKDLLHSGFYELRAYTRYMMNWGDESCYSRVIPIFNKPGRKGQCERPVIDTQSYQGRLPNYRSNESDSLALTQLTDQGMSIRFFPEGGHFVEGLTQRVAFEVMDEKGMPLNARGYLLADGKPLCSIQTLRQGRGVVECMPKSGLSLSMLLTDESGQKHQFALPETEPEGVSVRTSRGEKDGLYIHISATASCCKQPLGLLLTHQGKVKDFSVLKLVDSTVEVAFERRNLPDGIVRLSVINTDGHIWADRLVFLYPHARPDTIYVNALTDSLHPCEKTSLHIRTRSDALFSISVCDADADVNGAETDCWTWKMLTSDLNGYVHQPKYYLESDDDEHRKATDLLMMVQGWQRYDLGQMMGLKPFNKRHPVEDGLYVDGQLKQLGKKESIGGVDLRLTLYNKAGNSLQGKTLTNRQGWYAFRIPDCEGEWRMLIDTKKHDKEANYLVGIDRHFAPVSRKLFPQETQPFPLSEPNVAMTAGSTMGAKLGKQASMEEQVYKLPGFTVTKRRNHFENARAAWENEIFGSYRASIYYDIDRETDCIYDSGQEQNGILEWLIEHNPFFESDKDYDGPPHINPHDSVIGSHNGYHAMTITSLDEDETWIKAGTDYIPPPVPIMDYPNILYKNRPVIWILNNNLYGLSGLTKERYDKLLGDFYPLRESRDAFPVWMDEVKSVYIAEDANVWRNFVSSSVLASYEPVTIFVYIHRSMPSRNKGVRLSWFQGYDSPEKYEMPDYSALPHEDDFRRTLYWNPVQRTDSAGHAVIDFWNNSRCQRLRVSAEGLGTDGTVVVAAP